MKVSAIIAIPEVASKRILSKFIFFYSLNWQNEIENLYILHANKNIVKCIGFNDLDSSFETYTVGFQNNSTTCYYTIDNKLVKLFNK